MTNQIFAGSRWHRMALAAVATVTACMLAPALAQDADAEQLEMGKQVFTEDATPTCATCHALADADASGPVGPDLDDLQPSHDQILAALRDGPGAMPAFADSLSEEQMDAVAAYIVSATSGD